MDGKRLQQTSFLVDVGFKIVDMFVIVRFGKNYPNVLAELFFLSLICTLFYFTTFWGAWGWGGKNSENS